MKDAIVIKPALADQVKNAMIHGRVIFFSAPCGFGKTTTAWALLEGKKVYFTAAGDKRIWKQKPGPHRVSCGPNFCSVSLELGVRLPAGGRLPHFLWGSLWQ